MSNKLIPRLLYIGIFVAIIIMIFSLFSQNVSKDKVIDSKEEFLNLLESGEYYGVAYRNGSDYFLVAKTEENFKNIENKFDKQYRFASSEDELKDLTEKISGLYADGKIKAGLKTLPREEPSLLSTILPFVVIGLILAAGAYFMFQQMQGQNNKAMQFGRASARVYDGKNKLGFDSVAGADEEKEEMSELVDFLKNPKKFNDMGARIPKGVLLVGSPGTGKTLLAKAVAGEAGVPFYSITGSDFVELYVGIGASRVRDLFAQAKRSAPCIIFIDEIDAVGRRRGAGLGGGHDEREQTLNQLLVEMDGFNANEGIIVLAATNRADILDPALLRSGRFDRQIHVLMPDKEGRTAIFGIHTRGKKLADDVNGEEIGKLTIGFTGADIENLCNEAALLAVRQGRKQITMQNFIDAITKVQMGPEKKSRKVTEQSRRLTAYHEAGHALIANMLDGCDDVSEVSIIPRGSAGGYTMTRPKTENDFIARNTMLDDICMGLGGRVAEELCQSDISSGASADIRYVTKMAHAMVTEYGMYDGIGPVYLGDGDEIFLGRDFSAQKPFSDDWSAKIDDAVHSIIEQQLARARAMLAENREKLEIIASILLEREKITGDEFRDVLAGKELPPKEAPAPEEPTEQPTEQPEPEKAAEEPSPKQPEPESKESEPPRFF